VTLLKIEIDDAVRKQATALSVFHGNGGLQSGINPSSNTSMLEAADDQQGDATNHLRGEATANLIYAIDSAMLKIQAPLHSQEPTSHKNLR